VYWGTGTAHLLPRLLRLPDGSSRTSGPLFLSSRRPVPARRPGPGDICPYTGRARLGYDRARILLQASTGWNLHQLRHSAATHLGDKACDEDRCRILNASRLSRLSGTLAMKD